MKKRKPPHTANFYKQKIEKMSIMQAAVEQSASAVMIAVMETHLLSFILLRYLWDSITLLPDYLIAPSQFDIYHDYHCESSSSH